ncbi:unnamed protein product [Mytilus edulis]|uniref:SRCR domain-containing protein n=1 Tax=Mytilus edulis TaxID=6550 RepID=A0A8S3SC52_MYTED|nr:unnamed protein product [Mytilus edulis]
MLDDVDCLGSEDRLLNYSYDSYTGDCGHQHDIGVHVSFACQKTGTLRLLEGSNTNEGRLEVYTQDTWGTVCVNNFDLIDATIACHQLGYCSGNALQSNMVNDVTGTIWLADLLCSGIESKLVNCRQLDSIIQNCRSYHDIGLMVAGVHGLNGVAASVEVNNFEQEIAKIRHLYMEDDFAKDIPQKKGNVVLTVFQVSINK